jgi:hypothetical protein
MRIIYPLLSICMLLPRAGQSQCAVSIPCTTAPVLFGDATTNQPEFWRDGSKLLDVLTNKPDLPEGAVDLSVSIHDPCGDAAVSYVLLLDLDNNGSLETALTPDIALGGGRMLRNNADNPGYTGLDTIRFDARPVPDEVHYQFVLQTTRSNDTLHAALQWVSSAAPGVYLSPQLPYAKAAHRMIWRVQQGANTRLCTQDFFVKDTLKPFLGELDLYPRTILIYNNDGSSDPQTAANYLGDQPDNHTPWGLIQTRLYLRPDGQDSIPGTWEQGRDTIILYCSMQTAVADMWAEDLYGNRAHGVLNYTFFDQRSFNRCPPPGSALFCVDGEAADYTELKWKITPLNPPNPPFELARQYCYDSLFPVGNSYRIEPYALETGLRYPISVIDMVKIARHITGVAPFTSPYSYIAADINNSRTINSFDVVEFHKVYFGFIPGLSSNKYWRFIPKDYPFPTDISPLLAPYPEAIDYKPGDPLQQDFETIKTGYIPLESAGAKAPDAQTRSADIISTADQWLKAGQMVDVPVALSESTNWIACQLTWGINADLATVVAVIPGNLPGMDTTNIRVLPSNEVRILWYDTTPHALSAGTTIATFRLLIHQATALSEVIQLTSDWVKPEAYTEHLQPLPIAFQYTPAVYVVHDDNAPEPYPNPTIAGVTIPITLLQPQGLVAEVLDWSGRRIYSEAVEAGTGLHSVVLPAAAMPSPGVYYWRITRVGASAPMHSGKIIRRE